MLNKQFLRLMFLRSLNWKAFSYINLIETCPLINLSAASSYRIQIYYCKICYTKMNYIFGGSAVKTVKVRLVIHLDLGKCFLRLVLVRMFWVVHSELLSLWNLQYSEFTRLGPVVWLCGRELSFVRLGRFYVWNFAGCLCFTRQDSLMTKILVDFL